MISFNNMITNADIGSKIRELRIKAKLSQKELGEALGRSHAAISDIERGITNLTLTDLSLIADFLNIPINDFLIIPNGSTPPFSTSIKFQGTLSKEIMLDDLKLNIINNQQKTNISESINPTSNNILLPIINQS